MTRLRQILDMDGDGYVTIDDIKTISYTYNLGYEGELWLMRTFNDLDKNNNGYLESHELDDAMQYLLSGSMNNSNAPSNANSSGSTVVNIYNQCKFCSEKEKDEDDSVFGNIIKLLTSLLGITATVVGGIGFKANKPKRRINILRR